MDTASEGRLTGVLRGLDTARIVWPIFAIAAIAASALILHEARLAIWDYDDWVYLTVFAEYGGSPAAVLDQSVTEYVMPFPLTAIYLLVSTFGLDSYLPFQLLGLGLLITTAAILLEYCRRRVGYLLALPGAILLLFLGSADEVTLIPTRVPMLLAAAAGIGLLLALDRRSRRNDLIALALGVVAVLSHPLGLVFVLGGAVRLAFQDRGRALRSAWIVAIPALAYLIVVQVVRDTPFEKVEGLPGAPLVDKVKFASESVVSGASALTGTFQQPWTGEIDFVNAWGVIACLLIAAGFVITVLRKKNLSPGLASAIAMVLGNAIAPATAAGLYLFRAPDADRYIFASVLFLLILLAELGAAWEPQRSRYLAPALGAVLVVFVSGFISNVRAVRSAASEITATSRSSAAEFGALSLAEALGRVSRGGTTKEERIQSRVKGFIFYVVESQPRARAAARVGSIELFSRITSRFGAVGLSPSEIRSEREPARTRADLVLLTALAPTLEPTLPVGRGRCEFLPRATTGGGSSFEGGRLVLESRSAPFVFVGRFGEAPAYRLAWPPGARAATLRLPRLRDLDPGGRWVIAAGPGRARACATRER